MSLPILYVCELQAHKLCDSFNMCIFSVFIGHKCCVVCTHLYMYMYVPSIRACMRDTFMNPEVEFTVL